MVNVYEKRVKVVDKKSAYETAKENGIMLDEPYVIVEKSEDGKRCVLQRVYDANVVEYSVYRNLVIKDGFFLKDKKTEFASDTVENVKSYIYNYGLKVWNAEISKDGRLIIKKTHFPVIVIASLCHVYFSFLKNKTDNRAYVKSKINSWCDKEFSDMHYNFETKVIHRYFPSCVNREDFKDMVKMLRENTSQFEQYMYEDIMKLCK